MFNKPVFFERNRVGRVYTGGKLFGDFFGDQPVDGFLPEEWIASNVKAINKISRGENEGLSKIKDSDLYFDEYLRLGGEQVLGKGKNFRILVKGLDSAIRLPAQAHPDKAFSMKHFGSTFGKTECWIILGKRENAKIFFGFKDGVTREDFEKAVDASETDSYAMERLMCEIEPEIGDVYFVPAKTVHAIGKGCLILEVQEPTDFTIQPERFCGEYKLNDNEMYLGLSRENALDCFEFGTAPKSKIDPVVKDNKDGVKSESLICEEHTDCFKINRFTLNFGKAVLNAGETYAVYIVTSGSGVLTGENYRKEIKKGDYFFMPANLSGKFTVSGNLEIVECF